MITMDMIAKANGFESSTEMQKLIMSIVIDTDEKYNKFIDWKENDGSKEGLMDLLRDEK